MDFFIKVANLVMKLSQERTIFDQLKGMGFLQKSQDPENSDNFFSISARQCKSSRRNRESNFFTDQFHKFRKVLINFIQVTTLPWTSYR